ncbi:MAG: hypothetical protein KGJ64_10095, partial [Betaproteobacteria bacterium]|nr:hypothetical protein [Betaproteobacteria bacterium]
MKRPHRSARHSATAFAAALSTTLSTALSTTLCAACALLAAPAHAAAPPADEASPPTLCPATLPGRIDPSLWQGSMLDTVPDAELREVRWAPDRSSDEVGSVECHFESIDSHHTWIHPMLRSVFKTRQPDPAAAPAWHQLFVR